MKKNIEEIISDCYSEEQSFENGTPFNQIMEFICTNYQARFKGRFDSYLNYYKEIPFDNAIHDASYGYYSLDGKSPSIWFHQETFIKHNGTGPLEKLAEKLKSLKSKIKTLKDFHSLFVFIREVATNIEGIGPLSVYDTALRLGSHLKLNPDKIYIHSGTKTGYKALIDERCNVEFVERNSFRPVPYLNEFDSKYLEDILCIYKKTFKKMKTTPA